MGVGEERGAEEQLGATVEARALTQSIYAEVMFELKPAQRECEGEPYQGGRPRSSLRSRGELSRLEASEQVC